jgi:heme exporter protein B
LVSAIAFAALVLVIFNFARDPASASREALAPSVLWITFTFSGVIALNRSFALERENAALDGLLLAPVSRSAIFLGKYLANLAFVFTVEAVTLPLFVLFFGVDLDGALGGIVFTAVLATAGFVAVGTIFAAMTVRTRFAELMLPLLVLPFLIPPLIGAVQVTARLLAGRPVSEIAGWFRILALYDLVFVTLCMLLFPSLMDE